MMHGQKNIKLKGEVHHITLHKGKMGSSGIALIF